MPSQHESEPLGLRDLFSRVRFRFRDHVDFSALAPSVTLIIVRRLTQAAYRFNLLAVSEFGGRSGREREPGLVEQIVGAAFQTFGGADPHPDPFDKAAVLFRGIVQGHPFSDGNKRTGFLLTGYFLQELGISLPDALPADEVIDFCVRVSAGEVREPATIRTALLRLWGRGEASSGD